MEVVREEWCLTHMIRDVVRDLGVSKNRSRRRKDRVGLDNIRNVRKARALV